MKEYKVFITEKATDDILGISGYIAKELLDIMAADRLVNKLKTAIESLSYMPERNVEVKDDELAAKGIRRILVDNYIIFYITSSKDFSVSVIRVLYNKRNWKSLI